MNSMTEDWTTYAALASVPMNQGHHADAVTILEQGVAQYPDEISLRIMLGECLVIIGRWDDALTHLNFELDRDPTSYEGLINKALCLQMVERHDEAIEIYHSLKASPIVLTNWGNLLLEQGKHQEALALLDAHDVHSPRLDFLRANLYLGTGDWPRGWQFYQARASRPNVPKISLADLRDQHVILLAEQGLGDTLMFVRYAKVLRPFVAKLSIYAPETLRRLLSCLELDADVVDSVSNGILLPLLDVPFLLGTTIEAIPDPVPYAISEAHRLPENGKPRIGLVFAGSSAGDVQQRRTFDRRSMPHEMMRPLLDQSEKYDFISLQMPEHYVYERWLLALRDGFDMLDTASVVQQLDLVITIDSAVAHLAGSLNVPVWLLSRFDGCWRWFWDERDDSPWYPSMRIYRQKTPHSWPEVIRRVCDDLKKVADPLLP